MRRTILIVLLILIGAATVGLTWWLTRRENNSRELVLYGNVDLRQVQLSFNNSERIATVLVQEGERVRKGQLVARLDTRRLEPQVAQAEAQVAAQRQVVQRLHSGSRPEEIAQARANVTSAKADAENARQQYERIKSAAEMSAGRAVRQQDVDTAKAALQVAEAKLVVNQRALDLAVIGPRREDITDAKWVRAYVSESNLGKVHQGMAAAVAVDSFPNRRFDGWVGFISPVAEFTPKAVQTEELRTSLVYEVRVFVKDPSDELRLGMPATVYLNTDKESSRQGDKETAR